MKHIATLYILLLTAFVVCPVRLRAQSLTEPDVPTGLLERKGDKIVSAPAEDFALAKTYHAFKDKGAVVAGQRITILTKKTRYKIGEPVRVLHILEAVEYGKSVHVMGPKAVRNEYVDGKLASDNDCGVGIIYRGAVVDRPIADFNYDITTYTFSEVGEHSIQWKGGGHRIQSSLGLESNVIRLEIVKEPDISPSPPPR